MTRVHTPPTSCDFGELTEAEEHELAETESLRDLGISFDEFKRRWAAGDYREDPNPKVTSVAFWLH